MTLEAIRYRAGSLQILNQLLLPHQTVYDDLRSVQDAYEAIKSMKVRQLHPPTSPCTHPRGTRVFLFPVSLLLCSSPAHVTLRPPSRSRRRPLFCFNAPAVARKSSTAPPPADSHLNVSFPIIVFSRAKLGTVGQPATHLTCPLLHFLRERLLMNY